MWVLEADSNALGGEQNSSPPVSPSLIAVIRQVADYGSAQGSSICLGGPLPNVRMRRLVFYPIRRHTPPLFAHELLPNPNASSDTPLAGQRAISHQTISRKHITIQVDVADGDSVGSPVDTSTPHRLTCLAMSRHQIYRDNRRPEDQERHDSRRLQVQGREICRL